MLCAYILINLKRIFVWSCKNMQFSFQAIFQTNKYPIKITVRLCVFIKSRKVEWHVMILIAELLHSCLKSGGNNREFSDHVTRLFS